VWILGKTLGEESSLVLRIHHHCIGALSELNVGLGSARKAVSSLL